MTPPLESRTAPRPQPDFPFTLAVTLVYAAVLALVLARHELWRDEWQAWMIARDSRTMLEVLDRARYEGSPALWHLLLFPLSRLTRSPAAMQGLHLLLASAGVFVLCAFAPFRRWERVLLAFGYFSFYEYGAISRAYVLGPLLLGSVCALYAQRRARLPLLFALLAVMCLGSVTAAMVATALGAVLAAEALGRRTPGTTGGGKRIVASLAGPALVLLAAGALVLIVARPPADVGDKQAEWFLGVHPPRLLSTLIQPWSAYVPLPSPGPDLWGSNLVGAHHRAAAVLSLALLLGFGAWLRPTRWAFQFYLLGNALLLGFAYFKWTGALRHWGFLYLLLIAACWIAAVERGEAEVASPSAPEKRRGPMPAILRLLMGAQVVAAVALAAADLARPFSLGPAAAKVLRAEGLAGAPVFGSFPAVTIAGYLDRPIHYLPDIRPGTFVRNSRDRWEVPPDESLRRIRTVLTEAGGVGVLVMGTAERNRKVDRVTSVLVAGRGFRAELLADLRSAVTEAEEFRLYRVRLTDERGAPAP